MSTEVTLFDNIMGGLNKVTDLAYKVKTLDLDYQASKQERERRTVESDERQVTVKVDMADSPTDVGGNKSSGSLNVNMPLLLGSLLLLGTGMVLLAKKA